MSLKLRPRYPRAKGPHTGSGPRPGPDNSENRNNWSVALSGTERSPRSASPQHIHCTNRDISRQGMGRTVHNNFGCSVSGPHTVLCQSQYRHDRTTEVPCSSRETPVVIWNSFCSHLQGTRHDCADVTVIQVRISNTDWCIRSQAMILTLKLAPADLSAVTVAAALTQDTADSLFRTLS